jgi:hypothetical protein
VSSGELLHGLPWRVPLGSFSGHAKDLSMIALFPSNSPCLYLLQLWPLGPLPIVSASFSPLPSMASPCEAFPACEDVLYRGRLSLLFLPMSA